MGIRRLLALAAIVVAAITQAAVPSRADEGKLRAGEVILYSSDQDDPNPMEPIGFPVSPGKSVDLYLLSEEGTARLTEGIGNNQFAVWSPDGQKIAFESGRATEQPPYVNFDIYVINADGSGLTRLTTAPGFDAVPSWSPDGSRIAFTSFRDGDPNIFVMNADGSDQHAITSEPGWDFAFGNWCPDGRIVFHSDRETAPPVPVEPLPFGTFDVYVMDGDGSNVQRLTSGPGNNDEAVCSPDGSSIAFASDRTGIRQLYTMGIDGSRVEQVTSGAGEKHRPSWSPDGASVLFDDNVDGDFDAYELKLANSSVFRLTSSTAYDFHPVARPQPCPESRGVGPPPAPQNRGICPTQRSPQPEDPVSVTRRARFEHPREVAIKHSAFNE